MFDKRQERKSTGKQDAPHNNEVLGLYQISIQPLLTPPLERGLNKEIKDV